MIYYPDHVGHICEIGRLRLAQEDRNKIAGEHIQIFFKFRFLETIQRLSIFCVVF